MVPVRGGCAGGGGGGGGWGPCTCTRGEALLKFHRISQGEEHSLQRRRQGQRRILQGRGLLGMGRTWEESARKGARLLLIDGTLRGGRFLEFQV